MRSTTIAAIGLAALLTAGAAQARPFCTDPPFIPLAPLLGTNGSSVAEPRNNIEPGDLACFKVEVPAGRTLHVTVASIGSNASFRLYPPGWTIERNGRSFTFGGVAALPGAGEGDDARTWTGPMPQVGPTLVVIGMKHGGGQYRLHVEVF